MGAMTDNELRRIDWVGQINHRQPQDPIPIPATRPRSNHNPNVRPIHDPDNDLQVIQRPEYNSIKDSLNLQRKLKSNH